MQETGNNLQKIYLGAILWERHKTVSNKSLLYTFENRLAGMHVYGASLVALILKNLPAMQKIQVQSLGQEDPLEKEMVPTPACLENSTNRVKSKKSLLKE